MQQTEISELVQALRAVLDEYRRHNSTNTELSTHSELTNVSGRQSISHQMTNTSTQSNIDKLDSSKGAEAFVPEQSAIMAKLSVLQEQQKSLSQMFDGISSAVSRIEKKYQVSLLLS